MGGIQAELTESLNPLAGIRCFLTVLWAPVPQVVGGCTVLIPWRGFVVF